MNWQVFIANANGTLDAFETGIRTSIENAERRCMEYLPPIPLDIIVVVWPGRVIPELGHTGFAAPTVTYKSF